MSELLASKTIKIKNETIVTIIMFEWGLGWRVKFTEVTNDINHSRLVNHSDVEYDDIDVAKQHYDELITEFTYLSKIHYVAMSGLHGCIPTICQSCDSLDEAVNFLGDIYEMSKKRRRELKNNQYLLLCRDYYRNGEPYDDGNDYCEITECCCNNPEIHNDD